MAFTDRTRKRKAHEAANAARYAARQSAELPLDWLDRMTDDPHWDYADMVDAAHLDALGMPTLRDSFAAYIDRGPKRDYQRAWLSLCQEKPLPARVYYLLFRTPAPLTPERDVAVAETLGWAVPITRRRALEACRFVEEACKGRLPARVRLYLALREERRKDQTRARVAAHRSRHTTPTNSPTSLIDKRSGEDYTTEEGSH